MQKTPKHKQNVKNFKQAKGNYNALPEGAANNDVAVLIHSHPTKSETVEEQVLSFSAKEPTDADNRNGFQRFGVNIIVGRLGRASGSRNQSGKITKTAASLGISVYNRTRNGRVDLKRNRVRRIVRD